MPATFKIGENSLQQWLLTFVLPRLPKPVVHCFKPPLTLNKQNDGELSSSKTFHFVERVTGLRPRPEIY